MESYGQIANGLEVARKTTLNSHNTPITIFSDSQEALAKLRQLSSHTSAPYLRSLIYQETSDLESKAILSLFDGSLVMSDLLDMTKPTGVPETKPGGGGGGKQQSNGAHSVTLREG